MRPASGPRSATTWDVVQRGQVRQLDHESGRHDAIGARITELRGEQNEQWPKPLAARPQQMARRLRDERLVGVDSGAQRLLDIIEAGAYVRLEGVVGQGHAKR